MTSRTGSVQRILGILKKFSRVENWTPNRKGRLSLARRGLGQVSHVLGGYRWKGQKRKNVYLSPYVEKPLNSKVIKSFVPELRSCKSFSCFRIPMFYVICIWTSHVHFAYSCIWLWYKSTGVVEYADCISAEGLEPCKEFPEYYINLHLMVRFVSWSLGEYGVPLHCHYSQVHSELEW